MTDQWIQICDPLRSYRAFKEEIDAAIHAVLDRGHYVLGEEVSAFEGEFAAFVGVDHAIGVGNGTEALALSLAASGVGPGDEVVTAAFTALPTVSAIDLIGARPVLVDVLPDGTIDPAQVEAAIGGSNRIKAIVPVHLFGRPALLQPILEIAKERGLAVVEDCSQSHGSRTQGRTTGGWGDLGAFSLYPTKNLGALGDGGIVVTDDPQLAARVRRLRQYGWDTKRVSQEPGRNSRLDEIQAAVLRIKLRQLKDENERRRANAQIYQDHLRANGLSLPDSPTDERDHVFHQFVVRSLARDALREHLAREGVGTAIHFPRAVHHEPGYQERVRAIGDLGQSEALAEQVLSLPVHPWAEPNEIMRVCQSINAWSERVN